MLIQYLDVSHSGKNYVKTCIDENPIQDWPAVLGKLKQLGYDGWITVIENAWPQQQRKEVDIRSADYINDLWNNLTKGIKADDKG